jgi:hypothetical protein
MREQAPREIQIEERYFLQPLHTNIWMWSDFNEEKGLFFNGFALQTPRGLTLIDPPAAHDRIFCQLEEIACPREVLLTNADHERESHAFRTHYNIPVRIHHRDAHRLFHKPDDTFEDDAFLSDGLKVLGLRHQKSPGECLFYFAEGLALVVGDALIGKPAGQLSQLPADRYPDITAAFGELQQVLGDFSEPFNKLLLGDGEPVLKEAAETLKAFLAAPAQNA